MARDLITNILQQVRTDPGKRAGVVNTTAKIWHAPRLGAGGAPAIGYQPYRQSGPIVQAVSLRAYADFIESFLLPGGAYWIDPTETNEVLRESDLLLDIQNNVDIELSEAEINERRQRLNNKLEQLTKKQILRTEAEIQFAKDNVKEFLVVSDGLTKIDYTENVDEWDVITLGDFNETTYCVIKPTIGLPANERAITPEGAPPSTIKTPQSGQSINDRIKLLKNFSIGPEEACPTQYVRADGRNLSVAVRYPSQGDTWIGGILQNMRKEHSAFYRAIDYNSLFLRSDSTSKLTLKGGLIEFDVDPRAVTWGDYQENPVQIFGPSNAVTPVPRYRLRMSEMNFVAGVYNVIHSLLNDLEQSTIETTEVSFQHEVIDYNDFSPPSRNKNP